MNGREMEKQAWTAFGKWKQQWVKEHPEDDNLDDYTLSLMFPDGELPDNQEIEKD